ncbi:MAG: DUF1015 domain-containing protein [Oscillospiraceae bacterium]|jgi:uncharacterized protein (DUF1015 family)|nr:DUF1015 domain-containing protein [Oscillospiraceae bacterium]
MATVTPFRALMYDFAAAGRPEALCCPPYDIIPSAVPYLAASPYNIIRLEKPEGERAYASAAGLLAGWKARGLLRRAEKDAFYAYELGFTHAGKAKSTAGIFAAVGLREYAEGVIRPHENTLSKAKADRYELLKATRAQISPVYAMYGGEAPAALAALRGRERPALDFAMPDGVRHRLWIMDDPGECAAVAAFFEGKPLYIADGHHRYETALKARGELGCRRCLMFLADMAQPGLVILPTHRLVLDNGAFDESALLRSLGERYDIEKGAPLEERSFVLITKGGRYLLRFKDMSFNGLEVEELHKHIMEPLLGIDAAVQAAGTRLAYTHDEGEAAEAVASGRAVCAFIVNPTRASQVKTVADGGGKMPQKSTCFYPKLITGPVMYELDS